MIRTPFLWEDALTNSSIVVDVHPGGYGGITVRILHSNHEICITNDEICITNDEICITNDEICISNDEFCISNDEFCVKNDGLHLYVYKMVTSTFDLHAAR